MKPRELVVVKFGSESVVSGDGLDQARINAHAERLAALYENHDVLVVTSGAVAHGKRRLQAKGQSWETYDPQALAMLGTAGVNRSWEEAGDRAGLNMGQVLITHREMEDSQEGPYFLEAHRLARKNGVIPVANYNDFLSSLIDENDEIKELEHKADNDHFAHDIAVHLGATVLILATGKVAGFTQDGELMEQIAVSEIPGLQRYLYESREEGKGGMGSKLKWAGEAAKVGRASYICSADADFAQILAGEEVCTQVIQ